MLVSISASTGCGSVNPLAVDADQVDAGDAGELGGQGGAGGQGGDQGGQAGGGQGGGQGGQAGDQVDAGELGGRGGQGGQGGALVDAGGDAPPAPEMCATGTNIMRAEACPTSCYARCWIRRAGVEVPVYGCKTQANNCLSGGSFLTSDCVQACP